MKRNQSLWNADGMVRVLPWIRFAGVLVPGLLLAAFQCSQVRDTTEGNEVHRRRVFEMESANRKEEVRLNSDFAAKSILEAEADSVLSGLLKEGANPPDISALERLRLEAAVPVDGDNAMHVMVFTGGLEYHALVPALNQQEANSPMMRCKRLSLRNTGKPFHTSALPLHVDLEVAFPRLPASAGELVRNAAER